MKCGIDIVSVLRIHPLPIILLVDGVIAATISALARNVESRMDKGHAWPIIVDKCCLATEDSGLGPCLSFFEQRVCKCGG